MEPTESIRENNLSELDSALGSLTERDWEEAGWPVITSASKESYINSLDNDDEYVHFWGQIFNEKNFIIPGKNNTYNPKKDNLFVLHSFKDDKNNECRFKAITTLPEHLIGKPQDYINFKHHGEPCESNSRGIGGKESSYPTCHFWTDFNNKLPRDKFDTVRIPTMEYRKKFIKENILKNN